MRDYEKIGKDMIEYLLYSMVFNVLECVEEGYEADELSYAKNRIITSGGYAISGMVDTIVSAMVADEEYKAKTRHGYQLGDDLKERKAYLCSLIYDKKE